MFSFTIKDINGTELTPDSLVRLVDKNTEEPYGESSTVRLHFEDGKYTVRAFERDYACNIISDPYTQFVIVG